MRSHLCTVAYTDQHPSSGQKLGESHLFETADGCQRLPFNPNFGAGTRSSEVQPRPLHSAVPVLSSSDAPHSPGPAYAVPCPWTSPATHPAGLAPPNVLDSPQRPVSQWPLLAHPNGRGCQAPILSLYYFLALSLQPFTSLSYETISSGRAGITSTSAFCDRHA